jgi:hypothetical protein
MTTTLDRIGSLAALAANAPNTAAMLRWAGLQRRPAPLTRLAQGAGLLAVGAALGAGVALLLTPHNGAEMRRRLAGQAQRARDYVAPGERTQNGATFPTQPLSA